MELPKWASTILVNEFEDDPYWTEGIERDLPEAYYAIDNLQRSPKNINRYLESIYIYDKYIGQIIDYYGGIEMIMMYAEEHDGKYPPGYRDRPHLKLNKKNVAIIKSGNVPVEMGTFLTPLEPDEMRKLSDNIFSSTNDFDDPITDMAPKKLRKRALKVQERGFGRAERHERIANDIESAASYDLVAQYFASLDGYGSTNDYELKTSTMSIKELANAYDELNNDRDDGWEVVTNPESYMFSEAKLLSSRKAGKILDWSRILMDNGFENGLRKRLKKTDPSYAKFVARELGLSTKSNKQLKKQKKRFKKYENSLSEKRDNLRSLAHSLSRASSGVASDTDEKIFDDIIKHRR